MQGIGGFLYVDPLAVFFAITVCLVVVLAAFGSAAYYAGRGGPRRAQLVPGAALLRLLLGLRLRHARLPFAGNLGLLWVLIEASTLASCGARRSRGQGPFARGGLEVRDHQLARRDDRPLWRRYGSSTPGALSISPRTNASPGPICSPTPTPSSREASGSRFLLAVVGYGTKVGLAPMHTWLPDAHSEAPSPASAMLSAALLNTGMYAVIRFQAIAKAGLGNAYPDHVLLVFGFLTLFVGVIFMVRRGNFKRLFAYSSIEHMGIVAVALGFGGVLGLYGALLQVLNHAIGKAVLFLSTGDFVLGYRTRESSEVRGASARCRSPAASSCSPRSQSRAVRPLGCSSPSSRSSGPASQGRLLSWPGSFSSYSSSASSPSSARPWPWQPATARSRFILTLAAPAGSSPRSRSSAGLAFSFSSACGSRAG